MKCSDRVLGYWNMINIMVFVKLGLVITSLFVERKSVAGGNGSEKRTSGVYRYINLISKYICVHKGCYFSTSILRPTLYFGGIIEQFRCSVKLSTRVNQASWFPLKWFYLQISNIRRKEYQNLNVSPLVLLLYLPNLLKPWVKLRMKM